MTDQSSSASLDHSERDLYASHAARERLLNEDIVRAEIGRSFEEYLEIFDRFYADDIEVSGEGAVAPVRGKEAVRSLLAFFLVPLHIMAEIGGMSASIRVTPIPGDGANEVHSAWALDLVGVSGRTCTLTWRAQRKWGRSGVVYEHHYDQQQIGEALTLDDLKFNRGNTAA